MMVMDFTKLRCLCCGEIREKHSRLSGLCHDAKNFWTPNERIGMPDWAKAPHVHVPVAVKARFVERIRPPLDWAKPTPFNHFPDLEGWVTTHYEVLSKDS